MYYSRRPARWPCGGLRPFACAVGGRGEGAWGGWRYRPVAERRQGAGGRAFCCPDVSSPAGSALQEKGCLHFRFSLNTSGMNEIAQSK